MMTTKGLETHFFYFCCLELVKTCGFTCSLANHPASFLTEATIKTKGLIIELSGLTVIVDQNTICIGYSFINIEMV